jgi:hypothetical protein
VINYRHFANLADAEAYNASQFALMNVPPDSTTTSWADPILLADGSYVMPAYEDATAVPWDPSWVVPAPSAP